MLTIGNELITGLEEQNTETGSALPVVLVSDDSRVSVERTTSGGLKLGMCPGSIFGGHVPNLPLSDENLDSEVVVLVAGLSTQHHPHAHARNVHVLDEAELQLADSLLDIALVERRTGNSDTPLDSRAGRPLVLVHGSEATRDARAAHGEGEVA